MTVGCDESGVATLDAREGYPASSLVGCSTISPNYCTAQHILSRLILLAVTLKVAWTVDLSLFPSRRQSPTSILCASMQPTRPAYLGRRGANILHDIGQLRTPAYGGLGLVFNF